MRGVHLGHHERDSGAADVDAGRLGECDRHHRIGLQLRHDNVFLSICKGLPCDAKPREKEAAASGDAGMGNSAALLRDVPIAQKYLK